MSLRPTHSQIVPSEVDHEDGSEAHEKWTSKRQADFCKQAPLIFRRVNHVPETTNTDWLINYKGQNDGWLLSSRT